MNYPFKKLTLLIVIFAGLFITGTGCQLSDKQIFCFCHDPDLPVVIVDAGHGGEDGGAISLTGAHESDMNLAIAKRLDCAFAILGRPVVMLRTTDLSLHNEGAITLRQKKVSDLQNRVQAVNECDNAILISIHQNTYPGSQYRGAQVFHTQDEQGELLAKAIQQALIDHVDPENHRKARPVSRDIYLFDHIECPGILVECGFLTNPEEELLLQCPEYQNKLAVTIAGTIINHIYR